MYDFLASMFYVFARKCHFTRKNGQIFPLSDTVMAWPQAAAPTYSGAAATISSRSASEGRIAHAVAVILQVPGDAT